MFYILTGHAEERDELLAFLKLHGVQAIFHYIPLHTSPYYQKLSGEKKILPLAEKYGECLVRLPFYTDLSVEDIDLVVEEVATFFSN